MKKRQLTVTANLMGERFVIPQRWLYRRMTAPEHKYKSKARAMTDCIVEWISQEIVKPHGRLKK